MFDMGLRQHAINVIDERFEGFGFAVARLRERDFKVFTDARRIAGEHDHAIGQLHGFFDIMGNDKNRARGNFLVVP